MNPLQQGNPAGAFVPTPPCAVAPPSSLASSPSHASLGAPSFPLAAPRSVASFNTGHPSGAHDSGSNAPPYTPTKDMPRDLSTSSHNPAFHLPTPSPTTATTSATTTAATTPTRAAPPAPPVPHSASKVGTRLRSLFGLKAEQPNSNKKRAGAAESHVPSPAALIGAAFGGQGGYARSKSGSIHAPGGAEGFGPLQRNLSRLRAEHHHILATPGEQSAGAGVSPLNAVGPEGASGPPRPAAGSAGDALLPRPPLTPGDLATLCAPPSPTLQALQQQQPQQQQQVLPLLHGAPAATCHGGHDQRGSVELDAVPTLRAEEGIPTSLPCPREEAPAPPCDVAGPCAHDGRVAGSQELCSSRGSGLSACSVGARGGGAGVGEAGRHGAHGTDSSWGSDSHARPRQQALKEVQAPTPATRAHATESTGSGAGTQAGQPGGPRQARRPLPAQLECGDAAGADLPFESGGRRTTPAAILCPPLLSLWSHFAPPCGRTVTPPRCTIS